MLAPFNSVLVNIQSLIPDILIDLKYASKDNFLHKIIYTFNTCMLHRDAALQLVKVHQAAQKLGLNIKIWDGFRPMEAQQALWDMLPDERYVADPKKGGRHTRGTAVDLTLTTKEGIELPMPSAFDEFNQKAHRDFMDASKLLLDNRSLLEKLMHENGFIGLPTEWWHFDLLEWEKYPILQEPILQSTSQ